MNVDAPDSDMELILDHRKLILGFLLLICVCGGFFVIGFIEGKRQGVQEGSQAALEKARQEPEAGAPAEEPTPAPAPVVSDPGQDRTSRETLDWYKSINNRGAGEPELSEAIPESAPAKIVIRPETSPAKTPAARTPRNPTAASSKTAAISSYSVQVGAFRQLREAETKAGMLKAKGYDCFIEPPKQPEQLYLLKVGKFGSRGEAAGMQLKLRKDGFTTFIKANN